MADDLTPKNPSDEPELEAEAEVEETDDFDFLTASFETEAEAGVEAAKEEVEEPAEVVLPALAAVPEPEPEVEPDVPVLEVVPVAEVEVEAEVEPEPEPELEPEPLQVDSWEAAPEEPIAIMDVVAALEPEAEPEPVRLPWYKREISLGGGKDDDKPSAEDTRRRPQRRLRPEPEPTVEEPASVLKREVKLTRKDKKDKEKSGDHVPFYRREISLGRKKKDAVVEPEPVVEATVEPAEEEKPERVPFYKRELSLGRKKSEPAETETPVVEERRARPRKQPRGDRVPMHRREVSLRKRERPEPVAALPASEEEPTEERKPLYKRELSIRRRERPATAEAVKVEKVEKAEKPAKAPKVKRELRMPALPSLSLPTRRTKMGTDSARMKKVVGLKIGASQLAAAHVHNNGHAELVKVARETLIDGVISGGELRDPEALTAALRDFFKKHGLPRKNVRLGIANNRIGVRTFEIAGIEDSKQLANAIRFRAQEALPIPIEEAVIDWRVLSEQVDEEGQKTRRILLVVAYRELVDRYVAACKKAGIQLVGIDLEAFALLRALGDGVRRAAADGALVAVSVGHERSTFAVSDGEICEFTRVLEWGGNSLNIAIARGLDKAPSEVEDLKRSLSLESDEPVEDADAATMTAAKDAVRKQLQTFARELVSSLQFYQNQPGSLGIGEIILTGGTAQMPGLAQELERLIGVRVRVGDPLSRVKASKRVTNDDLGSLSVAIGLGIED